MKGYMLVFVLFMFGCQKNKPIEPAKNGLTPVHAPVEPALVWEHAGLFPNHTQLSIALLQDSHIHLLGLVRDQDTLRWKENPTAVYEIGSITKTFTSALLAHLVIDGVVDLHDSIQQYFPQPIKSGGSITLLQLANHTSGLPRLPTDMHWDAIFNRDNPYKKYNENKLLAYMTQKVKLANAPGQQYEYSNLGAGLLAYLLTQATQTSYEELLQKKIFQPLGMDNTTTNRALVADKLVKGLNTKGKEVPNWDLAALQGAGAILSTSEDLLRFAAANMDTTQQAYEWQRRKTFTASESMDIALGWHILHRADGRQLHWHNGGTGGYSSSMVFDTGRKTAVVVLSNVSAFHPEMKHIDQLCFALMERL